MALIKILQYPNSRLGTVAERVTDFSDPQLQQTIDDMLETLDKTDDCAGLASTQLDIKNPKAITVVYLDEDSSDATCLVNPEVIEAEGEINEPEACMSVGCDVFEKVKRAAKVKVKAFDREGKEMIVEAHPGQFSVRLLQHEIDHLNGRIFIDKLSKLKRQRVDKKFENERRWSK